MDIKNPVLIFKPGFFMPFTLVSKARKQFLFH